MTELSTASFFSAAIMSHWQLTRIHHGVVKVSVTDACRSMGVAGIPSHSWHPCGDCRDNEQQLFPKLYPYPASHSGPVSSISRRDPKLSRGKRGRGQGKREGERGVANRNGQPGWTSETRPTLLRGVSHQ